MWKHGSVVGALALLLAASGCQRPMDTERPADEPTIGEAEPWEEDEWMEEDQELAARIEDEIRMQLGEEVLNEVEVEVEDGGVTLTGQVDDEPMRHQLRAVVQDIEGVAFVEDQLEVAEPWMEDPMEEDPMEEDPEPLEPEPEPFPPTL